MRRSLSDLADALVASGANLTLAAPGRAPVRIGARPDAARVTFREPAVMRQLLRGELLALCDAYLAETIDIEGDFLEVVKLTELLPPAATALQRLRANVAAGLRPEALRRREAVAFHYDRSVEFFLAWLDRWRSYSHGLYLTPQDAIDDAQERKLDRAVRRLQLRPGTRVLDVGCGWGSFVEYAGQRGIEVHALTLDDRQAEFVSQLVDREGLPCRVDRADFFGFRGDALYDAVIFMGSLEHLVDLDRVAQRLPSLLRPGGRIWADFCSDRTDASVGPFLARHVWGANVRYVDPGAWVGALARAGFNIYALSDDTRSYGYTCRDWADALERERKILTERFGEREFRLFQVYLRAAQYFFDHNRAQAYHVVAGQGPAEEDE